MGFGAHFSSFSPNYAQTKLSQRDKYLVLQDIYTLLLANEKLENSNDLFLRKKW